MSKKVSGGEELARAAAARGSEKYLLRLFVAGMTPRSENAVRSVKQVCEDYLGGRYELEIVDIYQQPDLLKEEQVVVAPTLIKKLPLPLRRLIGDMASREKIIVGLDLKKE